MKKYLRTMLLFWSFLICATSVQASTIALEDWNDFSDWTLGTLSNPGRFTSQISVTSFSHTFTPTEGDKLLRISGGFESREPSIIFKQFHLNKPYLLFDWFAIARDTLPDNDATYFLVSTDGVAFTAYLLADIASMGGVSGGFAGWNTSYLGLSGSGDLYVGFAAIDHGIEGGAIFFGTDYLRLSDTLPTGNSASPVATYDFGNAPPTGSVPEPGSIALFGLGIIGLGITRRRKGQDDTMVH